MPKNNQIRIYQLTEDRRAGASPTPLLRQFHYGHPEEHIYGPQHLIYQRRWNHTWTFLYFSIPILLSRSLLKQLLAGPVLVASDHNVSTRGVKVEAAKSRHTSHLAYTGVQSAGSSFLEAP